MLCTFYSPISRNLPSLIFSFRDDQYCLKIKIIYLRLKQYIYSLKIKYIIYTVHDNSDPNDGYDEKRLYLNEANTNKKIPRTNQIKEVRERSIRTHIMPKTHSFLRFKSKHGHVIKTCKVQTIINSHQLINFSVKKLNCPFG